MSAVDVLAVIEAAKAECREAGHLLNPYRIGLYVGRAGYVEREVPSPYTVRSSVRAYNNGLSAGLGHGVTGKGMIARRARLDALARVGGAK